MGTVLIKCPNTGRSISTGIEVDRSVFESMPVFFSRSLCPVCRIHHEWFVMSAWFCDAPNDARSDEGLLAHSG
jgi:hypothetical protein